MVELTCENCGTEFDTDREAAIPGQDLDRCPSCGASADVPITDGSGDGGADETVTVDAGDEAIHLHIHIHRE